MSDRSIDHVALVVADLAQAERVYHLLGFEVGFRERVEEQGVDIVGMRAGESSIELLKPVTADSPLERFRGDNPTRLHHIAYRVADIRAELARLRSAGVRLIDEQPRRGAHGNLIAFIHPSGTLGTLIEICQRPDPAPGGA